MAQQQTEKPPSGRPAWMGNWKVWLAIAVFVTYILAGWHIGQLIGRAAVLAVIGAIVYILGQTISFQLSSPAWNRLAGWGLALAVGAGLVWSSGEAQVFDAAGNVAASIIWAPGALIIDGLKWAICIALVVGIVAAAIWIAHQNH